jgi:hypothetical protein
VENDKCSKYTLKLSAMKCDEIELQAEEAEHVCEEPKKERPSKRKNIEKFS